MDRAQRLRQEHAFFFDNATDLVNWYLVEDGGRVTIVDAGVPAYRRQLEADLAKLGRTVGDVAALVLTHGHADHTGFAEEVRTEPRRSTKTLE